MVSHNSKANSTERVKISSAMCSDSSVTDVGETPLQEQTAMTEELSNNHIDKIVEGNAQQFLKDEALTASVEELAVLTHKLFGSNLMFINDQFYGYKVGCWAPLHELTDVKKPILGYFNNSRSSGEINEIVNRLKIRYSEVAFPGFDQNLISLKNGVLRLSEGVLQPSKPALYLRNKINIDWDAKATCPNWLQFLHDVFRDDNDKDQKILMLQQWFGYCLTPSMEMQQLLMLVGQGENGKSVVMDVLAGLIGPDNTSHTMIEALLRKEFLAALEGKLLNISAEVPESAWMRANILKAYVSGDKIQARLLYRNPVTIKPTAKLMMSTNNLPKVYDHTHGFFRRVMILTFNRKFTGAERNRKIKDVLMAEMPGILVWAVAGLRSLMHDKDFAVPESSVLAKQRYQVESDDVQLFREEFLEDDPTGNGVRVSDLYAQYSDWAKASGLQTMNKFAFGKRLAKAGVDQKHYRDGNAWLVTYKRKPALSVIALPSGQNEQEKAA